MSLSHKPTRDKWRASPLGRFHSMNKLSITGMNSSSSSDEIPLLLKDSQTHPLNSHAVQHERSGRQRMEVERGDHRSRSTFGVDSCSIDILRLLSEHHSEFDGKLKTKP